MHLPPILAACLCFAFIIWLLRRDARHVTGFSAGLWVALVWLWMIASKPLAYWLGSGTEAGLASDVTEGSFFDRNAQSILITLGIIILSKRGIRWDQMLRQNRWLWMFCLFCGISIIWSPIPFVAFKRWIKDFGSIVMILIILTEESPTLAIRAVFLRCAYLLVPLSVLFIKYYPETGKYYNDWTGQAGYCGVTINKNTLGVLVMVSSLFLIWTIADIQRRSRWTQTIKSTWPELIVLLMCVWILKIADSKTSLGCLIIGSFVFLVTHVNWLLTSRQRMKWLVCGLLIASFIVVTNSDLRGTFAGALGREGTLTTRTSIWKDALELKTNPLVGAGFASVWLTPRGSALVKEYGVLAHSHDGYLETYLNTGLIGLILLLGVLFTAGRNSVRELSCGGVFGHLFAALFVSGVIYNYTEVTFNNGNIVGFSLWLMAMQVSRAWDFTLTADAEDEFGVSPEESILSAAD